ncbi:hypothetical protein NDU88_006632 [Pleurodeles waltl]|uniref:Uncharacterized protein n=1 Tax=Pleurodeles waltl TaxID=8319 RepID=A0AAV7RRR6_PLEWA|nr:hypothetical protein NDU88_006632 [Pleurodeles waltl]
MGKVDPRQRRLTFDRQKHLQQQEEPAMQEQGAHGEDDAELMANATAILSELCAGFMAINARFDRIAGHLDRMGERPDHQDTRLDQAED